MQRTLLFLVLFASLLVILSTGSRLPEVVGSHFDDSGHAVSSMARGHFIALMAALAVGVPLLIRLPAGLVARHARLNVPHAEYWNAPEQRPAVVRYLTAWTSGLSIAMCLFLTAIFVLVVRAHAGNPPQMEMGSMAMLLLAFLGYGGLASLHLVRFFRRVPRA